MKDNQTKYPQLRFKGFTDPWEQCKFGQIGSFYYGKSAPKWSVIEDTKVPCVRYGELYTKFGAKITKTYSKTSIDPTKLKYSTGHELLIPRVGEDPLDFARASWLTLEGIAIGEMISVFNSKQNPLFLAYYIRGELKFEFAKRVEGGNVSNLYYAYLENIDICLPSYEEQTLVANQLEKLDKTIALHQRKLAKLKELKQGYLQKLFPKNGSKFPQLRFAGFADAWEQRKFRNLYKKVVEKNDLSFGTNQIISVANMYYKPNESKSDEKYMRTYNIFRLGDIAFEGNKSKNFSYGRFVENTIGDGIVSHVFDVFRPIAEYDLSYWKYFIHYEDIMRQKLRMSTTKATMMNNLVSKDFLKQPVLVPELDEQKQIGTFFKQLDNTITLHQRKLEKLQELKKGYLQKMFC